MKIETQQQQSGWAMDGRMTPRSAAMDTFRRGAGRRGGGACRYVKWTTTIIWLGQGRTSAHNNSNIY